ncbi:MAG: SgcJ/EcaC family oxidoreductase [Parachlamydiales bacterium]|jgi:uncharacterized protein (TIGR02246 family)
MAEKTLKMVTEEEAIIRTHVENIETAWNNKNGKEFSDLFEENADFITANGLHIKGREANAQSLQKLFDTSYKDVDWNLTVEQIRFLRPDVATVHIRAESVLLKDPSKTINGHMQLVMKKNNSKWDITVYQFTPFRKI